MQKRLVRKLDLELFLSGIKPHPSPKPNLEQYTISVDVAATMLYMAAYNNGDIVGKTVLDLGCGTGRLALGAAFLGASQVTGVDIDKIAVKTALENSEMAGLKHKTQWVAADLDAIRGSFDTVLMNPPFGVQTRGADRSFLEKALEAGNVTYSLHKSVIRGRAIVEKLKADKSGFVRTAPSPFLKKFIEDHDGRIRDVYAMAMTIPHMFDFHTKMKHEFTVDLYIIERR